MLNKQDFSKINETELGNSQALFRDPALSGKYERTNYKEACHTLRTGSGLTYHKDINAIS